MLKRKNVALLIGILPLPLSVLLSEGFARLAAAYGPGDCIVGACSQVLVFFTPFNVAAFVCLLTLVVAIPMYFARDDVHALWFKWMMLRYLPVVCVITFCVALFESQHVSSGFGPTVNGVLTFICIAVFSVVFLLLSGFLFMVADEKSPRK
jgi:hypothetical protein